MFKTWSKQEEVDLLNEFKNMSIDDIATKHNRSSRAIELRLQDIAIKMEQDGNSYDTIFEATNVSRETIESRKIEKDKEKKEKDKNKDKDKSDDIKELKLEIRELKLEIKELKLLVKEITSIR